MVGLALPVGGDFFHNDLGVFGSDLSGGLLTGGQVAHSDVKEVAVEFGVQDAVTAVLSGGAAEEELTVLNDDGDVLGDVHEGLGPAEHEGLAFGFLHGLGEVQGALNVDVRGLTIELGDQLHHAAVRVIVHVLLALLTVEDTLFLRAMAFTGFGVEHFNCAHGIVSPFKKVDMRFSVRGWALRPLLWLDVSHTDSRLTLKPASYKQEACQNKKC